MKISKTFQTVAFLISFGILMLPGLSGAFENLDKEETTDFCVTELGRHIGAENALKMESHCMCAADLALENTPDSLKAPFARLVRREGLRSEDRAAFKKESSNLFLYIAMLDSSCPQILSDPQLQKLLLPTR